MPAAHLLAARSGPPGSRRRRRAFRSRRGARRSGQRAGVGAREGAGAAPVVDLRRMAEAAGRRAGPERSRARQEATRSSCRTPGGSTPGSPRPDSATSRSWRRSIWIARADCSQQESDREAIAELDRALYLSPYLADAHLLLGRIHLRNGRVRDAIDALKISLWSAEPPRRTRCWPRRTSRRRSRPGACGGRARARARSIIDRGAAGSSTC